MTAQFPWRQRETLRRIGKLARETADPVERLRYVRNQMVSRRLPEKFRWRPVRRIAAVMAAAIGAAFLIWLIR